MVEKTSIKGTGFSDFSDNSHVAGADIKDGKLIRIRHPNYDWKYKPEEWGPWKFEARSKVFEPPTKTLVTPLGMGYKKRICYPEAATNKG